jgi:hypothetical protein
MTDEPTEETDFAAFEAAATAPVADAPIEEAKEAKPADPEPANDEEAPPEAAEGDEEGDEPKGEKRRSKPPNQRIAELTARLRQAERDRDAALGAKPAEAPAQTELVRPDPNDEKYEFGEADPKFLEDLTDWKVDVRLAERDKKADAEASQAELSTKLAAIDTAWEAKVEQGAEKYADFNEVVIESAAAGEWPCQPMVAAAISESPVGHDVAYYLAKNPDIAEVIDAQLETEPVRAAEQFGYIEGGFMDAKPVRPPANAHPLDKALYAGRMRAFVEKKPGTVVKLTNAPEPPKHQVRGGSGKYEVGGDTADFAAFERKVNGR